MRFHDVTFAPAEAIGLTGTVGGKADLLMRNAHVAVASSVIETTRMVGEFDPVEHMQTRVGLHRPANIILLVVAVAIIVTCTQKMIVHRYTKQLCQSHYAFD